MNTERYVRDSVILTPPMIEALNTYARMLDAGYGDIGRRFVDRLKLTVFNRMLNGMTTEIGTPERMDLHEKMKEVYLGERTTIEIPATISGYTGALVASWDGEDWRITAHS